MPPLPTGVVTFFFSDVERSTVLLQELGDEQYGNVLVWHREALRKVFAAHGGVEVDTQGDSFFVAFARASDGVAAALDAQKALADGPIRIRVGVHTGEPLALSEGYVGHDVHRAARIAGVGHGGQILISQATQSLIDLPVRDLGEHRLKDLVQPERLYQVGDGDFPPLRSLNRTNLPMAAHPLVGRRRELTEIRELIEGDARLVTLTGPGGTGKTRLALQVAAELNDRFLDGVFFVPLASLADPGLVPGAVAQALGLEPQADVVAALHGQRALIVLDNFEHLPAATAFVAEVVAAIAGVFVVTSRSPLHLTAEHEYVVEPLPDPDARALFVERARAWRRDVEIDEAVAAICRRLDGLPLAIELAAARTKLLSPAAILERLDRSLPLLTGGPRDAPLRQQTLRATIEWSYQLLEGNDRTCFRSLASFRGGFTLEAAASVAGADLDALASLVDKSLLKPIGVDRFFMLETIREFAWDQLVEEGEADEVALRHAGFYRDRLEEIQPILRGPRTHELIGWYDAEADNIWAALDSLVAAGRHEEAIGIAELASMFWVVRGAVHGQRWMTATLEQAVIPSPTRTRALIFLGDLCGRVGNMVRMEAALAEALALAEEIGEIGLICDARMGLAWVAAVRGEYQQAARMGEEVLELSRERPAEQRIKVASNLATFLVHAGELARAEELLAEVLVSLQQAGDEMNAAINRITLGRIRLLRDDIAGADRELNAALAVLIRLGHHSAAGEAAQLRAMTALAAGREIDAIEHFLLSMDCDRQAADDHGLIMNVEGIALVAQSVDPSSAARLLGAATKARTVLGLPREFDDLDRRVFGARLEQLRKTLGPEQFDLAQAGGADLPLAEAVDQAELLGRSLMPPLG